MKKCGELGWLTRAGLPCGQRVKPGEAGCVFHTSTPEELSERQRRMQLLGDFALRALPTNYQVRFQSRTEVMAVAEDLARRVLTSEVDPKRVEVALKAANVALSAVALSIQEKLVDALLRLEHGGSAVLLLERLQDGMSVGKHLPLPGRGPGRSRKTETADTETAA